MSLAQRAAKSVLYIGVVHYASFFVSSLVNIALARLLLPEHFGTVGLAGSIFAFFKLMKELGFNQALRHKPDNIPEASAVHRSLQTILGGVICFVALAASPAVWRVYGGIVAQIFLIFAFLDLLRSVMSTDSQLLEKELMYKQTCILSMVNLLVTSSVSLGLAFLGFGVWSLVVGTAVNTIVWFAGIWHISPFRPGFSLDKEMVKWFFRFGPYWHWMLGALASTIVLQFDDLLVGSIVGAVALGFYTKAYAFARLPTSMITWVVTAPAFSIYSKLQNDRPKLSHAFCLLLSTTLRFSVPLSLGLVISAPEWIPLILGEKWLPMLSMFQLLVVYSLLRPILDDTGALFTAVGRPRIINNILLVQAGWVFLTCPPMVYLFGANGAAISVDIALLIGVMLAYRRLRGYVDIPYGETFLPPAIAAALAIAAISILSWCVPIPNMVIKFVVKLGLIGTVYLIVLLALEGRHLVIRGKHIYGLIRG